MIKKIISTILITSLTLGAFLQPAEGHHTKRYNSKGHRIKRDQRYNGQVGVASWYGHNDGYDGRKTASGKIFNKYSNMCAHNGFRFGTKLKVTNVSTGRFTVCNVQDTGAFTRLGRSLDLSYGSFGKIANPNQGLVRVKIEKIN